MPYSISQTNDSLTTVFTGGPGGVRIYTINSSHRSWEAAIKLINENGNEDALEKLMSVKEQITKFTHGKIAVSDNCVMYNGEPINGYVVDRILEFSKKNLPYQPLVKFLERVRKNPSARSIQELYTFLEHRKMPLTPEGTFLAYKKVDKNYMDIWTHKISNRIGEAPPRLERNQVDDDANRACSFGYHAGSLEYAKSYGSDGNNDHLMIIEVDPADVVCVPYDCNCQKLRATYYKVIDEFKEVLDDNYNNEYHEETIDDDDCECDECDESEETYQHDDELEYGGLDEETDRLCCMFDDGYDNGYNDGINSNGFDATVDNIYGEDYDEYYKGYQSGYDVGVKDRVV